MTNLTAARVTRTIAAKEWPSVQSQRKLAPGVFEYDCAGHGGVVALVEQVPDLPAYVVPIARQFGLIEEWVSYTYVSRGKYRTCIETSVATTPEGWQGYVARLGSRIEGRGLAWIGEEDCNYATLALVSEAVRVGFHRTRGGDRPVLLTEEFYADVCARWNAEFLAAVTDARMALGVPAQVRAIA